MYPGSSSLPADLSFANRSWIIGGWQYSAKARGVPAFLIDDNNNDVFLGSPERSCVSRRCRPAWCDIL